MGPQKRQEVGLRRVKVALERQGGVLGRAQALGGSGEALGGVTGVVLGHFWLFCRCFAGFRALSATRIARSAV